MAGRRKPTPGKASLLTLPMVRTIVEQYRLGALSVTDVALRVSVPVRSLQLWFDTGRDIHEGKLVTGKRQTKHQSLCLELYVEAKIKRSMIAEGLRMTQLTLARGIQKKDEDGKATGEYLVLPQQKAIDASLHNYDDDWKQQGKEITVNAGAGWDEMMGLIAAANEGIDDEDDDD